MITLHQLVRMSNPHLDRVDIAAANLACAAGLPGYEKTAPEACLRTIGEWKEKAAWKTVAISSTIN